METRLSSVVDKLAVAEQGEVKQGGAGRMIYGYAVVWDSVSQDLGGFKEVVRKGAFTNSLRTADVRALWNHDPKYVLGRVSASTLRVKEDEKGLQFTVIPPPTTWAQDLVESIRRGDVREMSFGFTMEKDTWSRVGTMPLRELLHVRLIEISIVSWPAYAATAAFVRAPLDPAMKAELDGRRRRLAQIAS
jgi:HK97 family phage prohead protease